MRYDILLQRLRPYDDYNFKTREISELSRKANEKELVEKNVSERIYDEYSAIIWNTTSVVSKINFEIEWDLYLVEIAEENISENRRDEYDINFQMETLYDAMINGILPVVPAFIEHNQAIKIKFPKE